MYHSRSPPKAELSLHKISIKIYNYIAHYIAHGKNPFAKSSRSALPGTDSGGKRHLKRRLPERKKETAVFRKTAVSVWQRTVILIETV